MRPETAQTFLCVQYLPLASCFREHIHTGRQEGCSCANLSSKAAAQCPKNLTCLADISAVCSGYTGADVRAACALALEIANTEKSTDNVNETDAINFNGGSRSDSLVCLQHLAHAVRRYRPAQLKGCQKFLLTFNLLYLTLLTCFFSKIFWHT